MKAYNFIIQIYSLLSEIYGEIVGVILCGHDGRRGYIYHTAVKSNYRGQGIGKSLLEAVYYALEQEGINKNSFTIMESDI